MPIHLSPFDAAAILVGLATLLGYVNLRWIGLPASVGMTAMGAVASLAVVALDRLLPGGRLTAQLTGFLADLDFHRTLMNGMLSFLLFAGALHVDGAALRRTRLPVLVFSTIGVAVSAVLVGLGFLALVRLLGLGVAPLWCFVFGALISPTDPVAVLAMMKRAAMPATLQATIAGESLFNDGIGVVVFTLLLGLALAGAPVGVPAMAVHFLRDAGGGALLGWLAGWGAFGAMRGIDDANIEVMLSLALVMGGQSLAHALGVSAPVAMVTAGLVFGNAGIARAMSAVSRDYLVKFWLLIDEILNAVLFLLIGMEVVALAGPPRLILAAIGAIVVVTAARAVAIGVPLWLMKARINMGPLAFPTLLWGGLRGGIPVALALSLPASATRTTLLAATYGVVLFSVIVQGGSMRWLIARLSRGLADAPPA